MKTKVIQTLEELREVAHDVLHLCEHDGMAPIIALSGDLGAGKTAFVKEVGMLLGIEYAITSPTFTIMKSYPIHNHPFLRTLTHIDAYRIESDDEMRVLGFDEIIKDMTRILCIEWPEKIHSLIPSGAIRVSITLGQDGSRSISYGR